MRTPTRLIVSLLLALAWSWPAAAQVNVAGQSVTTSSSPTFVNQTLTGKITLPTTTGADVGSIYFGGTIWAHSFEVQPVTTTVGENTFVGRGSGNFTMTGTSIQASRNTGFGYNTLHNNTTGLANTAVGTHALDLNEDGNENTGVGRWAIEKNKSGIRNTGLGASALREVVGTNDGVSGSNNTAAGDGAGAGLTTGSRNLFLGVVSAFNNGGVNAVTTGSDNIFACYNCGLASTTQVDNCILIGNSQNACDASNKTIIGNASTTVNNIKGTPAKTLVFGTSGAPGTTTSTTAVMCGSAIAFTPTSSARAQFYVQGLVANSAATGSSMQLRYGTGTAPVNGAGASGTQVAQTTKWATLNANSQVEFTLFGYSSTLTPGTAYWVDCAQFSNAAGPTTTTVTALYYAIEEL